MQTWFPDLNTGTYTGQNQGPWTVTGTGDYVLYGGEFTSVNSAPQQGLARFATKNIAPNKQGPLATGTGFQPTATETSPGTVKVSWPANFDRDNTNLTYTIFRDGVALGTVTSPSVFWNRPTLSFTATNAPAGTHQYTVSAVDPLGNTVTSPSALTNQSVPTLTAKSPGPGATGVPVGSSAAPTAVKVTFSENVTGVSGSTFTLKQAGTAVPAVVAYDPATRVATLSPNALLSSDKTYTIYLSAAIKSESGGSLVAVSWNFTTGPAPTVTTLSPASGATGVSVGSSTSPTRFDATFSEPVTGLPTAASPTSNFTLNLGTTLVDSRVLYDPGTRVATLTANAPLIPDKTYTLNLLPAVKDGAGNPIAAKTWKITTGPAPTIGTRTPSPGATGVARTANVTATFTEAVTGIPTTAAASSTFTIKQTSTNSSIASLASYTASTKTATLDPTSTLAANTQYTVTMTNGVKDLAGNPLTTTSWSFTTGSA